jgi:hypothetical protein
MGPRFLALAAMAAVLAGVTASPALAQDDGVTVDPGSPSGKEYAIPLQAGRANGGTSSDRTGGGKTAKKQSDDGALFGVGVGDGQAQTTSTGATPAPPKRAPKHRPAKKPKSERPATTASPATPTPTSPTTSTAAAAVASSGGGDGGGATVALIVAGVLAAGLLGGGLLRRQARSAAQ